MKIKLIVIDLEVSARAKRIAAAVLVPLLVLGGGAVAYANVPHNWTDGDTLSAADLNGNFNVLDTRMAALEKGMNAYPDCPQGYTKDAAPANPFNPASILCTKGADEVVKVGVGASAFWIDRYEASVWTTADGPVSGEQKFAIIDDSSVNFPKNGQTLVPLYALSVTGKLPASGITWFQELEACAASGKRLPTGSEWLRAARGTFDPGANPVTNNKCNTDGQLYRNSGSAIGATQTTSCVSDWGAQDMIGNVWEATDQWYASPATSAANPMTKLPDPLYGGDLIYGVASGVFENNVFIPGWPGVEHRGGSNVSQADGGLFTQSVEGSPTDSNLLAGFRCVIPR